MSDITRRDRKVMDFLRRQAIDNRGCGRAKLAAAVVIKGKIISTGRNQYKTHPFQTAYAKNSEAIFLHAETAAICNSLNHVQREDLAKATLYIYRVKRPHHNSRVWAQGLALPCRGCMRAIVEFNIKKIIYTTDISDNYSIVSYK